MMVVDELAVWGPESTTVPPISLADAEAYCRKLARSHYENFPVVTWALPRDLRQHFYNVYAFCRWSDDLGDEVGDPVRSLQLLSWWREGLAACYADQSRHPVFVALNPTIRQFSIPIDLLSDLISAFEQDQSVHEYETFSELRDYCRRSADPVGRIVLHLCRRFDDRTAILSDSICTGLQLANFWQDVARDRDMGRTYLPREDRQRFGYDDRMLDSRVTNEPFRQLMEYEVNRAREHLECGFPLVDVMPGRLKIDIELFVRGGLQILREIERIDYRVWDQRPTVSKAQFAGLLLKVGLRTIGRNVFGQGRLK